MLASIPLDDNQRVMALFDVYTEEMFGGEILSTLETAVHVEVVIMHLVFVVGCESQRFCMRRQRACHFRIIVMVVVLIVYGRV